MNPNLDTELRQLNQPLIGGVKDQNSARPRRRTRALSSIHVSIMVLSLLITTAVSCLLLLADARHWTLADSTRSTVVQNRASVQLVIQLLANTFALIWVSFSCASLNYATRIYFADHPVRINTLRLWHSLCSRSVPWRLPIHLLVVVLVFVGATALPAAVWAGALTPVATTVHVAGNLLVPAYHNMDYIQEYGSEVESTGPSLRSQLGFFTYSVGVQMQGNLLSSAASATPVDGGTRNHQKLDYTTFNYIGRSYGMGASVGLDHFEQVDDGLKYLMEYQETGFDTRARCSRNMSSDFTITGPLSDLVWVAGGELPNSTPGEPESSRYIGYDTSKIVAIGVGRNVESSDRILAIAAGESYQHLDKIQCSLTFQPTLFNISVGIQERNISVIPLSQQPTAALDFDPANLTQVLTRQFELIANDQTNLYASLVGNSLNASIGDYIVSQQNNHSADGSSMTLESATPFGLENALEAMADDMLVSYASAQLLIAKQYDERGVVYTKTAFKIGASAYIYTAFGINVLVLVLLLLEVTRTRAWRRLEEFDFMDPADLVLESVRLVDGCVAAGGVWGGQWDDPGMIKVSRSVVDVS